MGNPIEGLLVPLQEVKVTFMFSRSDTNDRSSRISFFHSFNSLDMVVPHVLKSIFQGPC